MADFVDGCLFLIWNDYRPTGWAKRKILMAQGIGLALLLGLAIIYRGGDAEQVIWIKNLLVGHSGSDWLGVFVCCVGLLAVSRDAWWQ